MQSPRSSAARLPALIRIGRGKNLAISATDPHAKDASSHALLTLQTTLVIIPAWHWGFGRALGDELLHQWLGKHWQEQSCCGNDEAPGGARIYRPGRHM